MLCTAVYNGSSIIKSLLINVSKPCALQYLILLNRAVGLALLPFFEIVIFPLLVKAGEDFHTLEQTLDFHSHESLVDVNLTIINDELIESNETLVLFLRNDTGVKLSPYAHTEIIIYDGDAQNIVNNDVKGI